MSTVAIRRSRARRELVGFLRRQGAITAATACPVMPANSFEARVLARMIKHDVIRPGMKGGYWLDEERYAEWKRQQLLIAFGIALVMSGLVACLTIYGPDHPRHHVAAAADSTAQADSIKDRPAGGEAPPP